LSEDQTIEDLDADNVNVSATVRDAAQLEWWLSAFGPSVEIQEPPELRRRMIEASISLHEIYHDRRF
jgi:predicted DNA-binding transcriptional regulator YafY